MVHLLLLFVSDFVYILQSADMNYVHLELILVGKKRCPKLGSSASNMDE